MATQTEIRTSVKREDRVGGFASTMESQRSLINPDFRPFSYGQETQTIVPQEPAFEVEKQYDFDMGQYQPKEQEEVMQMPTFERSYSQVQEREIVASTNRAANAKIKLNARGKIIATVYTIIVAILFAFCIYNAVSINNMQNVVASKNNYVSQEMKAVNKLEEIYANLGDNDTIISNVSEDFVSVDTKEVNVVDRIELTTRPQAEEPTNWFEEFCQKFKKLFS